MWEFKLKTVSEWTEIIKRMETKKQLKHDDVYVLFRRAICKI